MAKTEDRPAQTPEDTLAAFKVAATEIIAPMRDGLAALKDDLAKAFGAIGGVDADVELLREEFARLRDRAATPALERVSITEESSGDIDQLVTALAAAQAVIKNPVKDKTAKVTTSSGPGYSYDYADLASVLDAARPALAPNKLALLQFPSTPDARTVRVRTVLAHASGQWVAAIIQTSVADARPQSLGSAITYLRRYTIQSLLGITAEDDDDAGRAQGLEAATGTRQRPRPDPQEKADARAEAKQQGQAVTREALTATAEAAERASLERAADAAGNYLDEVIGGGRGTPDGAQPITRAQREKLNAVIAERATALGLPKTVVGEKVKDYLRAAGVASGSSADLPRSRFDEVMKFAASALVKA